MYSAVFLPGPDAGNVAAELLHVVGDVDRVEGDRRVEIAEEDDQPDVEQVVDDRVPGCSISAARCAHGLSGKKLAIVPGKIRIDEAKIGGITPDGVDLERQVRALPAVHPPADDALRVLHGDAALAALHEDDRRDHGDHEDRRGR